MNKRRPSPVINQYPDNQTTFTEVISQPGPTSYIGNVKQIKKVAVLCKSSPKTLACAISGKN